METTGFRDGAWFTNRGHPRTDAAKVTERFRRVNFGYMELVATIDDPKAYTRPWTSDTIRFLFEPDTELLEHLCENNRDASRLLKILGTGQGACHHREWEIVMKTTFAIAFCLTAVAFSGRALAHHAFAAEFDNTREVKVTGTVTKMEWQIPTSGSS